MGFVSGFSMSFELQWGRASVCPEGGIEYPLVEPAGPASMGPGICVPGRLIGQEDYEERDDPACFNGAGHLCARKDAPGLGQRPDVAAASMGPGICVPGRPHREAE